MSDGPHRSLKMRKHWRELAKRGDQHAYDDEQVLEAAANALNIDFKNEIKWQLIDALKSVFTGKNNSLGLPEIALEELRLAKSLAAGSVFGMSAVEWSIELIREGRFGLEAFYDAIGLAAKMRGFANVRSVEEHYLRESSVQRASHVSKRICGAITNISEAKLGQLLATPESVGPRRLRKRTNLDDGVSLP